MKRIYKNYRYAFIIFLFASTLFANNTKHDDTIFKTIQIETWVEYVDAHKHDMQFHAYVFDVTFDNNFGFIYSSGQGLQDQKKHIVKDIAVMPTYTFFLENNPTIPQVKLVGGVALPTGKGILSTRNDNTAFVAIALVPMYFYDGLFHVEAEMGYRKIFVKGRDDIERPHLGLNFDMALFRRDIRLRYLVFTGPYYEVDVPSITNEIGLSYVHDSSITYDVLFGTQPELENNLDDAKHDEYWTYMGVRLTFGGL